MDATTIRDLQVAHTAREAWDALPTNVLDKTGRDRDFVELLKEKLAPGAATIQIALGQVTLPQFIHAFFEAAAPLVEMLKEILELFKRAGATTGPEHWRLKFDDYEVDLEHFKRSMELVARVPGYVEHPAFNWAQGWAFVRLLEKDGSGWGALQGVFNGIHLAVSDYVRPWIAAYETHYLPLPVELEPPQDAPAWIHAFWGCIRRATAELQVARLAGKNAALDAARKVSFRRTDSDAFALDSICANESDYWLRTLVVMYASALEQSDVQMALAPDMDRFLAEIPVERHFIESDVNALVEFLDLPIWQRRYEFYAAWIGSRLVAACEKHTLTVCHDDGAITLPFKETRLAHISSAAPERALISERRTELANPVSKDRVEGVQPDYGFWKLTPVEQCDLVVEVKHYKRAAVARWVDVFIDYAAAHPNAKVAIVNYGAPGVALDSVPSAIASRCHLIGNLRPGNAIALEELNALVREAVGAPGRLGPDGRVLSATVVLLDVSASMQLDEGVTRSLLSDLVAEFAASNIAVANTKLRGLWSADEEGIEKAIEFGFGGDTELDVVIGDLLRSFDRVIVITDDDGRTCIDLDTFHARDLLDYCETSHQAMEIRLLDK